MTQAGDTAAPRVRKRLSPDGRFELVMKHVDNGAGYWNHLDIDVVEVASGRVLGHTTRNYGNDSILTFLQQDGRDYLLISENYHGGYGCMDLATGEKSLYDPEEASTEEGEQFWCWAAVSRHDDQAKQLVISGCYWAAPYERATMDFSNPMSPPYALLNIEDDQDD